ncbi:FMN-dependent NADH-azoreductase [Parasulfitobacter algicola]|uniref:FMN dependent NADH:quinone oxidoreductase n=1 Tax=Parasulfitobacter algicola TaxID=2614809 RepID=A0ABX2IKU6_9RHOB|nr:NAD(P)H-dependent oxidoreductase [Sulfitobacter algicola]NSX53491.1 NAD(P)H-dependent oxidoreductase [Sulfitobacter algicola]
MEHTILRIDASARTEGSVSRDLTDTVIDHLKPGRVITRDLAKTPVPQIGQGWVSATFTPAEDRNSDQKAVLQQSDTLVEELMNADVVVISFPIYNFGVPAALKAWIDQIARVGLTFSYSAKGPVGLLKDKRVLLVAASGGTEVGSDIDFATGYMRHVMRFIGLTDVTLISADQLAIDAETTLKAAKKQIAELAA